MVNFFQNITDTDHYVASLLENKQKQLELTVKQ